MDHWRRSQAFQSLHHPKLKPSEQTIFDELRRDGYVVLRNGWPDFMAVRGNEIRLIEVKGGSDSLSTEQRRVHRALRRLGIEVEIIRLGVDGQRSGGEGL